MGSCGSTAERERGLERRLQALERSLGRWRRAGAAGALVALAVVASGQAVPTDTGRAGSGDIAQTFQTERLVARHVMLMDGGSHPRIELEVEQNTPRVAIRDTTGNDRLVLSLEKDREPTVVLAGTGGDVGAVLRLGERGAAELTLGAARQPRLSAAVDASGTPTIVLRGPGGEARAGLRVGPDGAADLDLLGPRGAPQLRLRVGADGEPELLVAPADGSGELERVRLERAPLPGAK